jgi:hypothetical protein
MVFSATASSMPAFAASCPINSSILPRPRPVTRRILDCEFILICHVANYKRSARVNAIFIADRFESVAALQEQVRNLRRIVAGQTASLQLSTTNPARPVERDRSISS